MAFTDIDSRQAVLDAVAEFDQIGREEFLKKYGYREAQRYFLEIDGKRYDSKAIVGVAHKYQFPAEGALTFDEFSGGESTVQRKLEKLGFHVVQAGQVEEDETSK
jgi:5-methylcytosine-specific restriction protein A